VFLLAYTPCVATLATQRREIGLRWTLFGIAMQLATAWLLAVLVFQVGRLFW
jgi:ferrous iron transport protein B